MKWMIECTTDLFNSTDSKPHFINERCFGEDFVGWLVEKLNVPNFKPEEPFQEDCGWAALVRAKNETFMIGVGIMDESIGEVPARWLLMIDKMRRFIIFGSKRSKNLDLLADAVESVLRADPRITDIERFKEGEF